MVFSGCRSSSESLPVTGKMDHRLPKGQMESCKTRPARFSIPCFLAFFVVTQAELCLPEGIPEAKRLQHSVGTELWQPPR